MYQMLPLLAISLIVYAVLTLTGVASAGDVVWHEVLLVKLKLASGETWSITFGDLFLVVSMGLLFVELLRATSTGSASIINHGLSVMVFLVALLLFIFVPGFGSSVFFLFMTMTLLDFLAGFIVTIVTARRDFAVTDGGIGHS